MAMFERLLAIGLAVLATGGCRQVFGLADPIDAGAASGSDARPNDGAAHDGSHDSNGSGSVDGPPGQCFGSGLGAVCFQQPPSGSLTLTTQTINTDTSSLCSTTVASGPSAACVVAAQSIDLPAGAVVTGIGSKSLVLVASNTLTVSGTLDVSSRHSGTNAIGAAANFSSCAAGNAPGSGGGGGGGSMGGAGGNGGGPSGGIAGGALAAPTTLHGGCPGAKGSGTDGGAGGHGGGAVYLIAGVQLTVDGTIDASGAAGGGGDDGILGGGGGGSGGMIGLDAPNISVSGTVFANGGGGGGGGANGAQAQAGSESVAGAVAGGGAGGQSGGNGGSGAVGATLTGSTGVDGGSGTGGGGGGGGGAGVIKTSGALSSSGLISPPAT